MDGRTDSTRGHRKQSSRLLCGGFCYLECSPVPLSFARWRLYDVVPSPNLSATSIYIFAADHCRRASRRLSVEVQPIADVRMRSVM